MKMSMMAERNGQIVSLNDAQTVYLSAETDKESFDIRIEHVKGEQPEEIRVRVGDECVWSVLA